MSVTCRTFFLVVEQPPTQTVNDSVSQYSCAGILQDCGLNISVSYLRSGPPFAQGTVLFVEGSFVIFGGYSMIFAETAEDLNCPHPTSGLLIPFRPRLWFEGFLIHVESYKDTTGLRVLVLDVLVEGPVSTTVRCKFIRSQHLISALPVLYRKHKLSVCGDICGWSDHDIVDVDIFNINYVVYPESMVGCEVLYKPTSNEAVARDVNFVGASTRYNNPALAGPHMKSAHADNLSAYDLNDAGPPTLQRLTSDPISEVMAGAVESVSKDIPFKVYGWSPKAKAAPKLMPTVDSERPQIFKTQTLSL